MYNFSTKENNDLLKEIFEKLTEYDVYSYYIGKNFKVNSKFKSPLRRDNNPSFGVFVSKKTKQLLFKDLSTGESGNCIKLVQLLFSLSYQDALIKIKSDLIGGNINKTKYGEFIRDNYEAPRTNLHITRRRFNNDDLEYWESFGISKSTLLFFNVIPVEAVWKNDKIICTHNKNNPIYAYSIYNKFKIYKPFDKTYKFISNCSLYDIQGYTQLPKNGDLLIITKSLKDCMVLHELGYVSISANAEGILLPKKIMQDLSKRFKEIIIFYDNDKAGIEGAIKMASTYNLQYILIPNNDIKDISDYSKLNGLDDSKNLLKILIENERKRPT